MTAIPIAVVGVGELARDQHLPDIEASERGLKVMVWPFADAPD